MAGRRTSLGILLPVWLVVFGSLVWTAGWFYVRSEAAARLDEAIAHEAAAGRRLDCGERSLGGFPFRLAFTCEGASLVLETADGRTSLRAPELRAVALVYDLQTLIVEADAPVEVETFRLGGARRTDRIDAETLRASLGFVGGQVGSVSFVATGIDASMPPFGLGNDGAGSQATGDRAAIHLRQAPGGAHDLALELTDARLGGELAAIPFQTPEIAAREISFIGRVSGTGLLGDGPISAALLRWQRGGGKVDVQTLRVDAEALDMELSGTVALDAAGRPEGKFRGAFGRLDQLIAELKARGALDADGARIAAGAVGLLARPTENGTRAVLPVRVTGGEVYLGPIRTMLLPALF
jgi:hypothetical protein